MSTKHAAALSLAQLGYNVFPCVPGGKKPACKNGFKEATTDEAKIEAWWSEDPNYNIGLATAGLLVVDVDGADNPLLSDADKMLDLAAAPIAKTPTGGRHYFFKQPEGGGFRNTQGILADKVDTRADGGYVVAAPSANGEKSYSWLGEPLNDFPHSLPLPPQWVVDDLAKPKAKAKAGTGHANTNGKIPKGQRNGELTSLAGSLRRAGSDEAEIVDALLAENERCDPPLPEDEVRRIAASVARYEPKRLTDVGNGERFAEQHGHCVRYSFDWKKWFWYDGRRWLPDANGEVYRLAKQTARNVYAEASRCEERGEAKQFANWAHQTQAKFRLAAMLDMATSEKTGRSGRGSPQTTAAARPPRPVGT